MKIVSTMLVGLVLLVSPVGAQQGPPGGATQDPLSRFLFPPDLIMRHAQDLGLDSGQRAIITEAITELQAELTTLNWRLQEATQTLEEVLEPARVDEAAALETMERLMEIEREVKLAHLGALVRIKNALTLQQQQFLEQWRQSHPGQARPEGEFLEQSRREAPRVDGHEGR